MAARDRGVQESYGRRKGEEQQSARKSNNTMKVLLVTLILEHLLIVSHTKMKNFHSPQCDMWIDCLLFCVGAFSSRNNVSNLLTP